MKTVYVLVVCLFILVFSGCNTISSQSTLIDSDEPVYTQVGMWTEKGHIVATNYSRGTFIPVNSVVTIRQVKTAYITFEYQGHILYLKNTKYTQIDIDKLFERTFAAQKVDLISFTDRERESMAYGDIVVGMSKKAVLLSRGYPPMHQTFSLNSNRWKYWTSKYLTKVYVFKDDKVLSIK